MNQKRETDVFIKKITKKYFNKMKKKIVIKIQTLPFYRA
jgi:hypothetical protein